MEKIAISEHLSDLRKSAIKIMLILTISFVVCYNYGEAISEFLLAPLRDSLQDHGKIVYIGILDKILSYFQVSFWSSLIISSPFWMYQIWAFIKPALHPHETSKIRPFIIISFFLFILGVLFGYFAVFPITFKMLLNFGVTKIEATLGIKQYLVLSVKVLVFLGIIFQFPMIIFILGLLGIVTKKSLSTMRPYIYVALATISALLTPPDILTMLALWIPLFFLFELGFLCVKLFCNKKNTSSKLTK